MMNAIIFSKQPMTTVFNRVLSSMDTVAFIFFRQRGSLSQTFLARKTDLLAQSPKISHAKNSIKEPQNKF